MFGAHVADQENKTHVIVRLGHAAVSEQKAFGQHWRGKSPRVYVYIPTASKVFKAWKFWQ